MSSFDARIERAGADLLTAIEKSDLRLMRDLRRPFRATHKAVTVVALATACVVGAVHLNESSGPSTGPTRSEWSANAGAILTRNAVHVGSLAGWELFPVDQSAAVDGAGLSGTVEVRLSDGSGGILLVSLRLNDPVAAALESSNTSNLLNGDGDRRVYLRTESFAATAVELYRTRNVLYVRWEERVVTPKELAQFALELDALWRTTADEQFETRSTLLVERAKADT